MSQNKTFLVNKRHLSSMRYVKRAFLKRKQKNCTATNKYSSVWSKKIFRSLKFKGFKNCLTHTIVTAADFLKGFFFRKLQQCKLITHTKSRWLSGSCSFDLEDTYCLLCFTWFLAHTDFTLRITKYGCCSGPWLGLNPLTLSWWCSLSSSLKLCWTGN